MNTLIVITAIIMILVCGHLANRASDMNKFQMYLVGSVVGLIVGAIAATIVFLVY